MSVTAGVSDTVIAVRDKLRGKIGANKSYRVLARKGPEWADAANEDGDIRMFKAAESPTQDSHSYNVRKDDPRLRRWVESRTDNREDVRADHRRFWQAEIVATTEEEATTRQGLEAEEYDADAKEERRRRIKEKMSLQREQEDEAPLLPSEDEEEEEKSEYDTESEEELNVMLMLKPLFVPKLGRHTIAERV